MYKILSKTQLSDVVWEMVVEAPLLACHASPGQVLIGRKDATRASLALTIRA